MAYVDDNKIHSHLDRLAYDEYREKTGLFGDYWMPAVASVAGLAALLSWNSTSGKPLHTGLWRAGLIVPACAAAGLWIRDSKREKNRLKWAGYRHYIELHPEDFPPYPRRVKVGETLAPWIPRRPGW
ncbi:hypothetical protein ONE63_004880 [Megalurothrips usitatus]|uniref:NADH dehydrogenase [ubiquinone] 1 subunit C2 n=1 Tax=Megalurothrips usitatus TaxID=439358 RepID=A0AAV7X7K7_9NEOP|nr:hypothetical protein ONE63_004880 [Megalurothrips usitatus]